MTDRLSFPELLLVRKFLDTVDFVLSFRIAKRGGGGEEAVTELLGDLLDSDSLWADSLEYNFETLTTDLDRFRLGHKVEFEFQVNEHSKYYSGRVTKCDLGIVLKSVDATGRSSEKAVLLEAKRLYPDRSNRFHFDSAYAKFDSSQYMRLRKLEDFFGSGTVHYLFYNPVFKKFDERSQALIRAAEVQVIKPHMFWPTWPTPAARLPEPHVMVEWLDSFVPRRPGTRVMQIDTVQAIVEESGVIHPARMRLDKCYEQAGKWLDYDEPEFETLGAFIANYFLPCHVGSTDPLLLKLARGEELDEEDVGRIEPVIAKIDAGENPISARHTLTIQVSSTLGPQ